VAIEFVLLVLLLAAWAIWFNWVILRIFTWLEKWFYDS